MKQLTHEKDLIGKTIERIVRSEFLGSAVMAIKFTDGSFAGVVIDEDHFRNTYLTICKAALGGFATSGNSKFQYEMGFITLEKHEEVERLEQERYIKRIQESEIEQLKKLKEKYPNE